MGIGVNFLIHGRSLAVAIDADRALRSSFVSTEVQSKADIQTYLLSHWQYCLVSEAINVGSVDNPSIYGSLINLSSKSVKRPVESGLLLFYSKRSNQHFLFQPCLQLRLHEYMFIEIPSNFIEWSTEYKKLYNNINEHCLRFSPPFAHLACQYNKEIWYRLILYRIFAMFIYPHVKSVVNSNHKTILAAVQAAHNSKVTQFLRLSYHLYCIYMNSGIPFLFVERKTCGQIKTTHVDVLHTR